MKTKERDVKYCGCSRENIKSISLENIDMYNLKVFYYYVIERYNIFKKREFGIKYPWTEDIILRSYRFTNVFREDDKTSRWLIKNISNGKFQYSEKIYRTILFRLYNNIETAKIIKLNSKKFSWSIKDMSLTHYSFNESGKDVYTRAYKTVGMKAQLSKLYKGYDYRIQPIAYVRDLRRKYKEEICEIFDNTKTQRDIFKFLKKLSGIGDFIAYQIFVDLTYIEEFPYSENEFVVCGPGCRKGMDYIFKDLDKSISYEERLFWLRDNIDSIFKSFDEDYDKNKLFDNRDESDRNFNIMSLQNCMCEFSKYLLYSENKYKKPRVY